MEYLIADFASKYLAETPNHPKLKDWNQLPTIVDRFFFHNPHGIECPISGEEAARLDGELITKRNPLPRFPILEGDRMLREQRPPFDPRKVREILYSDPKVVSKGAKRGASFGNIHARPVLSPIAVADLIAHIMESNPEPCKWEDLCIPVLDSIGTIHRKGAELSVIEPGLVYDPQIPDSKQKGLEEATFIADNLMIEIPFLNPQSISKNQYGASNFHPAIWPRKEGETDEDFQDWLNTNYNPRWFRQSSPNFQRLLKSNGEIIAGTGSNGIKRSMWIHSKHIEDITKSLLSNFDTLQLVHQEVDNLLKSSNLDIPSQRHRLEQLAGELRFLSDELRRVLHQKDEKSNKMKDTP